MKINITVPVHNEEKILVSNVTKILDNLSSFFTPHDWTLVIAENGSTDNTGLIAEKIAQQQPQVFFIASKIADKWSAIRAGWVAVPAEIYIFFDADLATDLKHLPELLSALETADLAIGTRHQKKSVVSRPWTRSFFSHGYCWLVKIFLRLPFTDFQCGFKAVRYQAWQKISPFLTSAGLFTDTEILAVATKLSLKVTEVPITWREIKSPGRKSKAKIFKNGFQFIGQLLKLKKRLAALPKK
ncbi:MAG: glycosyltransferase [Candidatus Uhrbacteria bacterium]